jgi:hypothetical protein
MVFRFQSFTELVKSELHIMIRYEEESVLLYGGSMNFSGKQFTMHPGIYELRLNLHLPVRQGKYDLEAGLLSSGKWIDTWRTSTRLTVLDTFDHQLDPTVGILNIETSFAIKKLPEPVSLIT